MLKPTEETDTPWMAHYPGFLWQDAPDAKQFKLGDCSLQFQNVSFGYTPATLVLKNASFKIEGGKTVALVGPTGSGKSTALRLIFRRVPSLAGTSHVHQQSANAHLEVICMN